MKVKDAMHAGCEWVAPETRITEIGKRMARRDIGAVPVGENDNLIGIVTDRAICCKGIVNGQDIEQSTARDLITTGIDWCREKRRSPGRR